ncbi:hypothetical protein WDV92_08865 [Pseudomonas syringae pv. atrofaciens]
MTLTFSQRMGLKPIDRPLQIDGMDDKLRKALWNALTLSYWNSYEPPYHHNDALSGSNFTRFSQLYAYHHDMAIDRLPLYWSEFLGNLRKYYFGCTWHEAYGFIEFVALHGPEDFNGSTKRRDSFIDFCNNILDHSNSVFRFVNGVIAPISSEVEIQEVERALHEGDKYSGVKGHLQAALGFLTGAAPNYRNSIKESISAVETLCRHLTNDPKATLGVALKNVDNKHKLEPTIKVAFEKLYGYTNDANGIRHSSMEDAPSITSADARYMLISCSAFVNFVIDTLRG